MFGIVNIQKPIGPSSHDMLLRLRRRLPGKIRTGHAGTLDPFAEGVLVVCLGGATRLAEYVQQTPKTYRAVVRLGARSTTDDPEGEITLSETPPRPELPAIAELLKSFVGEIQQVPPAHSAVHVGGRRAYDLARAGETLELPPRRVTVYRLELLDYQWPSLELDVHCGSGTYIRSLARDIGEALGVGGYCERLARTAVGPFSLEQAVTVEEFSPETDLMNPAMLFLDGPHAVIPDECNILLEHGKTVPLDLADMKNWSPSPPPLLPVLDAQDNLLALAELNEAEGFLKPRKVFLPDLSGQ